MVEAAVDLGQRYAKSWTYRNWSYQAAEDLEAEQTAGQPPRASGELKPAEPSAARSAEVNRSSNKSAAGVGSSSDGGWHLAGTTAADSCLDCGAAGPAGRKDVDGGWYCDGCWESWCGAESGSTTPRAG